MTGRLRAKRSAAALAIFTAALLLSGCVYLRLLELKRQISAFDQNFTVQTDDGVRLVCRNPVLLSSDVRWFGLAPQSTKTIGSAQEWEVRWIKQLPPGVTEAGQFDIVVGFLFANDKLTRVSIPERYFAVMPKKLLVDLLRSLGGAKVDKSDRSVEAQLSAARPSLGEIDTLLGKPTSRSGTATQTALRYRYVPVGGGAKPAVFDMLLTFDTSTGQLLRWQGNTPVGRIGFNFQDDRGSRESR